MSAIIFLIFLGILVAGGFLAAFIWAVRSGQFDDDYSPSVRMLFDKDDIPSIKPESETDEKNEVTESEEQPDRNQ